MGLPFKQVSNKPCLQIDGIKSPALSLFGWMTMSKFPKFCTPKFLIHKTEIGCSLLLERFDAYTF